MSQQSSQSPFVQRQKLVPRLFSSGDRYDAEMATDRGLLAALGELRSSRKGSSVSKTAFNINNVLFALIKVQQQD